MHKEFSFTSQKKTFEMIVNDAKLNKPIVGKSIYSRGFAKKTSQVQRAV